MPATWPCRAGTCSVQPQAHREPPTL